ncbi:uncharacterized protein MYCFIDRAFT_178278 [Pseudocercospora fijiensis CIRAD86]|uniref:Uncharacterized protein n=1 Tax=Pseudocercospora fijiensis (strain CIRAD86) TaxID=383855 RepID=M2YPQ2_PSEFD|nr:uncharacterized protein MYCFIDRAFT_178278 [Pseudocercospora fijiensis CIRAD86]EME79710.1 hypothetical protein MYCFIDRAFT_178278 [Pseudocercospora fijiensis CIRAD86]
MKRRNSIFISKLRIKLLKHQERKIVFAGDLQLKSRLDKDMKTNFDKQDDTFKNGRVTLEATERLSLLVIGAGNYAIEHNLIDEYALTAKRLAAVAYELTPHTPIGASISYLDGPSDLLFFAPTTIPYSKSPEHQDSIVAHQKLNEKLRELDDQGLLDVMWTFNSLSNGRTEMFADDRLSTTEERIESEKREGSNMKGASEVEMRLLAEEEDQEKPISTPRWLRTARGVRTWPSRLKYRVLLVLVVMKRKTASEPQLTLEQT